MVYSKMLASAMIGVLTLSSRVFARDLFATDQEIIESRARCYAFSLGISEATIGDLTVEAAADAFAYVCNGEGSADAIATATGSALASAVAVAAVQCEQFGNTKVQVDAKASAKARAELWATAYFDAFAASDTCDKCEAFALAFGYIEKYVILEAAAKAEAKLDSVTTADSPFILSTSILSYKSDVEKAFASAFAVALTDAANYKKEEECFAFVNAGGCIWTEGVEDEVNFCAECTAVAFSDGAVDSISAIADASASAVTWTCGDAVAIAELEVTASALAEATAEAFSFAYVRCSVSGGGVNSDSFVCAVADSSIEVWVRAVAKAYATLWAGAYSCTDTCTVEIEVVTEAVGEILLDAATAAYAEVCASGEGTWRVRELAEAIKSAQLCALAEASALAISSPDFCIAAGITYAGAKKGPCPAPVSH